ncbi:hypothetical protein [Thermococcus sp. 9N3]|uniref:hypothetical protein n=1 Tax=Thermococcus sp. 9N3 TaxID=163002 RepID=UPI0014312298|nr:hypothetical protein [Thermococcus sp. 9N3]
MVYMGALDAFSKAFSLVAENKRAYLLVLVALLLLSVLSFSQFTHSNEAIVREKAYSNVLFEEYGTTSASPDALIHELEASLLELFITVIVLSLVEYSVVKAYFLSLEDEDYSLLELLTEAVPRIPAVILVNILAYITALLVAAIPLVLLLVGAATLNLPIAFFGLLLFFAILPVILTFFVLVVPAYVESEGIGAFVEAFGLTFKNLLSSFGYGVLSFILAFGLALLMAPLLIPFMLSNANPLVIAVVEAPFKALFVCFLWVGGVLLYRDFKGIKGRKEEFLY